MVNHLAEVPVMLCQELHVNCLSTSRFQQAAVLCASTDSPSQLSEEDVLSCVPHSNAAPGRFFVRRAVGVVSR